MSELKATDIVITALASQTAVGGTASSTVAAILAGVTPFVCHDYFSGVPDDPEWDADLPISFAHVPNIDVFTEGKERFEQLLTPTINEIFANSHLLRSSLKQTGFLLATPSYDKAMQGIRLDRQWLTELLSKVGLNALTIKDTLSEGNTGVISLVSHASKYIRQGTIDRCIIGGVDSFSFKERITLFDELFRVKTSRNVDGFIPGEASSLLMLESAQSALSRNTKILAVVRGIGEGMEPNAFDSELSSTGRGLADSIRSACEPINEKHMVADVFCDLNGESYFSHQWGLMQSRLAHILSKVGSLNHPADCVGHIGAASGALLCVCAAEELKQKSTNHEHILVSTANENGLHKTLRLGPYHQS